MGEKNPSDALKNLESRLERLKAEVTPEASTPPASQPMSGLGMAWGISAHLVAGLAVGGLIGWLLDGWLGTQPVLFLVFFFLGAAAGGLNIYRTVKGYGLAAGYHPADTAAETSTPETAAAAETKSGPETGTETKTENNEDRRGQSA